MIASSSLGWPGISYSAAGLGLIWCGLWLLLGANKASDARFIGEAEKAYIVGDIQRSERKGPKKWRFPGKAFLPLFQSTPFSAPVVLTAGD